MPPHDPDDPLRRSSGRLYQLVDLALDELRRALETGGPRAFEHAFRQWWGRALETGMDLERQRTHAMQIRAEEAERRIEQLEARKRVRRDPRRE